MSERGRVVLIFGIVVLIAGGAGYYFFKIHQPAQHLKAARAEITAWETRYQDARACLLGRSPGSAKTSEALAIREMTPDQWDRGKCTPLVSKLSRGKGTDSGVEDVEAAWVVLDKAANKAALAFATHVGSSTTLRDDPLPKALDDLDAARRALRKVVDLPAGDQMGPPLQPAQIVPITDGSEPVTELTIDAMPSSRGLVAFGNTTSRQVQITLAPGGTPKVARVGPGAMRAVPGLDWGATPGILAVRGKGKTMDTVGDVKVGAMNAEGVIAAAAAVQLVAPLPGGPHDATLQAGDHVGSIMLAAVIGTLAEGALVFGGYQTLTIARAKDNAILADPAIKIDVATAQVDLDGRAAVVFTSLDKAHKALLVRGGRTDEKFELPDSFAGAPCLTSDRIWVMATKGEVYSFGGNKPLARMPVPPLSGLQGCTADVALVRGRDKPNEVSICTAECRNATLPAGAPDLSAITVVGGKLYAISAHAGVLGVWAEHKPPTFFALPERATPVHAHEWPAMALTDGKQIDVIARGEKSFVLIRIPAP